jgi:uncharacterized membrane protein
MRLAGHPLHPMLVHFPIAFWTSAFGADLGGLFFNGLPLAVLAFGASALGCLLGLVAMIAGILDFAALPNDSPARDTAVTHMLLMCVAWLLFLVGLALRGYPPAEPAPLGALIVTALGFGVMAAGGWLGGRLVYEFGVGRRRAD